MTLVNWGSKTQLSHVFFGDIPLNVSEALMNHPYFMVGIPSSRVNLEMFNYCFNVANPMPFMKVSVTPKERLRPGPLPTDSKPHHKKTQTKFQPCTTSCLLVFHSTLDALKKGFVGRRRSSWHENVVDMLSLTRMDMLSLTCTPKENFKFYVWDMSMSYLGSCYFALLSPMIIINRPGS